MRGGLLLTMGLVAGVGWAQEPAAVEAVRAYALSYSQSLPDYTCSQETRRIAMGGDMRAGAVSTDTIEEELSFVGKAEHYKVLKVNGAKVKSVSHEKLDGAMSTGEFGGLLRQIFDKGSATAFRPEGTGKIGGRTMTALGFRVPEQTGYRILDHELNRYFTVAYEGTVWADAETNAVMKIAMKLVNVPSQSSLENTSITLEYKAVDLSGQQFILPSRFDWNWRERPGARDRELSGSNQINFTNCRKFTAESNIDFGK